MALIFSTPATRATLSRAAAAGTIKAVSRGIYTDELDRSVEQVVAHHRWELIAHIIPDAVIVDRSAATGGAATGGALYVASPTRARDVHLPGLDVLVRHGERLDSDLPWAEGLVVASPGRTLIDNLAISRGRRGRSGRTLTTAELGDWVARQARLLGHRFESLRQQAHQVANQLGVLERTHAADELIDAALGRRVAPVTSAALTALAAGHGYDDSRLKQLSQLADDLDALELGGEVPVDLPAGTDEATSSLGFWEAYFSNHIEGTIFPSDEAEHIVRTGELPADRPADGHDILGTHRVVTDPDDRGRVPYDANELLDTLRARHSEILAGRPELRPGEWKTTRNQAGTYVFVEPQLVKGTLIAGFEHRDRLRTPFARALYMLFLIAEVHPFADGNGRVARTFMNAELTSSEQARIVIPIVWRNEYLTAMRQLSRDGNSNLYARTLAFAWRWTAAMPWADPISTRTQLERTDALMDSNEAARDGRRLLLP